MQQPKNIWKKQSSSGDSGNFSIYSRITDINEFQLTQRLYAGVKSKVILYLSLSFVIIV